MAEAAGQPAPTLAGTASAIKLYANTLLLEKTNLHSGKAYLDDGEDVGGKEGCSLARGSWSLTMGSGIFSRILYNGMQVLMP